MRTAEDEIALAFLLVNETWRLLSYRQASLILGHGRRVRVAAVSGVANADRNGALAQWLRALGRHQMRQGKGTRILRPDELPPKLAAGWDAQSGEHGMWVTLAAPGQPPIGGLWVARPAAFTTGEATLAERIGETFGHAWAALQARRGPLTRLRQFLLPRGLAWAVALGGLAAILAVPVTQTALAPAEVVPRDPAVVGASLDGVVAEIHVQPNQAVAAGDRLFSLDRRKVEAELDVAEKALAVALADFQRASRKAFTDAESNAERAVLAARAEEAQAQVDYVRGLLARTDVTAPKSGVAVFGGADEWIGRPIAVGEGVMSVVDPSQVRLRIALPAADAIALDAGAPVWLFLDVDPLRPVAARLAESSYAPTRDADGTQIYELLADFEDGGPRLGLVGTARVEGRRVTLFHYLMRRPLIFLRRALG